MDKNDKKIITYIILIFISVVFINSSIPKSINSFSTTLMNYTFTSLGVDSYQDSDLNFSVGLSLELVFASILVVLPTSLIGGFWFGKLSYGFFFGRFSQTLILNLPIFFNKILGLLCLVVFVYSFFEQYKWINKMYELKTPKNINEELKKFI
jgi:hypothetical protein